MKNTLQTVVEMTGWQAAVQHRVDSDGRLDYTITVWKDEAEIEVIDSNIEDVLDTFTWLWKSRAEGVRHALSGYKSFYEFMGRPYTNCALCRVLNITFTEMYAIEDGYEGTPGDGVWWEIGKEMTK